MDSIISFIIQYKLNNIKKTLSRDGGVNNIIDIINNINIMDDPWLMNDAGKCS